jgi:cytochrome c556
MKTSLVLLSVALACSAAHAANTTHAPPNLHDLMKKIVAVQAQVIWDVGNQAQDDKGNPDASKLKPTDWTKIVTAGTQVKTVAQTLAKADHVMASAPGQKIDGEGGSPDAPTAKQVQGYLDANPQVFRAFAQALSVSMDQIVGAAQAKNAQKLFDVSGNLDQICEDCHVKFWYPNQPVPR